MRSKLLLLSTAVLGAVLLAGCSHDSGGSGSARGGAAAGPAPVGSHPASPARDAPPGAVANGAAGSGASGTATTPLAPAKIRTAELTVSVHGSSRVAAQADRAEDIAVRAGGEVDADDRTSGKNAAALLRLRVPPTQLRAVLSALSSLGTEHDRSSSVDDATERVADVGARITSARDAIARLRALYTHASKIDDVLAVEAQLSSRQANLESLEAQQRALSRQTTMAAVVLHLTTASAAPVRHPDRYAGFVGALRRGWDGFLVAVRGVGTALGAMLPFLVVLAALALISRFVLGLRIPLRRRRP